MKKIVSLFLLTLILIPSLSYAYSQDPDGYHKASQYSPGWVIDSVYDPRTDSVMAAQVDRLNNAEAMARKGVNNKDKDNSGTEQLPIKKKSSGADRKALTKTQIVVTPDEGDTTNVVHGIKIPGTDPNFITPEKAKKMFEDGVANSPLANGEIITLAIPGSDNIINIWQDGDNVVFNMTGKDGSLIQAKSYVNRDYVNSLNWQYMQDATLQSYLTATPYFNDGILEIKTSNLSYGYTNVVGYKPIDCGVGYNLGAGYRFDLTRDGTVALKTDTNSDMTYFFQEPNRRDSVNIISTYSFDTGYYYWEQTAYKGAAIVGTPLTSEATITPTTYTPPPPTITTTTISSFTPSPYRPYSKYDSTFLDDAYNQHKTNQNNDQPILSSGSKGKEDKTLTDRTLDKANPNNTPITLNKYNLSDYRNNPYLINESFTDPSLLKTGTTELEDLILVLESKEGRTALEDSLLSIASAVNEDIAYLDQKTLQSFNEVTRIVNALEEMKSMLREEDFLAISQGLMKLAQEQRGMYDDYISKTDKLYERIAALLGISATEEDLKDEYKSLSPQNIICRRKIAVDKAIRNLKTKDVNMLAENEKEAMKIDKSILSPIRDGYVSNMSMLFNSFSMDMKDMLKNKSPVSLLKDNNDVKALVVISDSEIKDF